MTSSGRRPRRTYRTGSRSTAKTAIRTTSRSSGTRAAPARGSSPSRTAGRPRGRRGATRRGLRRRRRASPGSAPVSPRALEHRSKGLDDLLASRRPTVRRGDGVGAVDRRREGLAVAREQPIADPVCVAHGQVLARRRQGPFGRVRGSRPDRRDRSASRPTNPRGPIEGRADPLFVDRGEPESRWTISVA
jgi:hypothetical protein